jgi:acetylornithine deacetylase/succinyl-diaminopimelate desuccinylase-like protein
MPHPRGALIVLLSLLVIATITLLPAAGTGGAGNSFRVESSRWDRPTAHPPELPSDAISAEHMLHYQDLAVRWMAEYLRIDTTNPPGNELKAAEWFKRIFDAEGIENRLMQYAPGRADIWARVPASRVINGKAVTGPRQRPIVLLNHMDVVSADPEHWRVPPFSATIVDGAMYGRGAQDMKSEALAQLLVLLMVKREQPLRDRDVIFLGTADEEVHDTGTDWFLAHHPELLGDAEFLLTEGGENLLEGGRYQHIGVDVAEKIPFWLHVVAHGQPGHGSRPIEDSAPNRLLRALNRILNYQPELKVLPEVEGLLAQMAPYQPRDRAARFHNIRQALKDKEFQAAVAEDESLSYLLRDTISVTMLQGSKQTNVIPEESWANLDVRLLPGEDPKEFLETMRKLVDDPNVSVEPLDGFSKGNSSPIDTPLFASIRRVTAHYFPGAPVLPRLASGYNESQRYRPFGIICYGFSPFMTTTDEGNTEHGDNERIRLDELRRGFRLLYDIVLSVPASDTQPSAANVAK